MANETKAKRFVGFPIWTQQRYQIEMEMHPLVNSVSARRLLQDGTTPFGFAENNQYSHPKRQCMRFALEKAHIARDGPF